MPTVTRAIRIGESAAQQYARWRDPAMVGQFLGVETVAATGTDRMRWRLRGPADFAMDLEARLTRDEPDHLMVWKAVDAPFPAIAAVRFEPLGEDETRITLQLTVDPPGGPLIHRATESYLARAVEDSLRRLATLVARECAPAGRDAGDDR